MTLRVAEFFAGIGGIRAGVEGDPRFGLTPTGFRTVFSNQWEPGAKRQWASDCYVQRFGAEGHVCQDIREIAAAVPDHDLLVGGLPCPPYSRANHRARGLAQKDKGDLFWHVLEILKRRRPPYVLLENVDTLLGSPRSAPGNDFARMLSALFNDAGYLVEWRVVKASDYGYPQRRSRILVFAFHAGSPLAEAYMRPWGGDLELSKLTSVPQTWAHTNGVLARAFPLEQAPGSGLKERCDFVPHTKFWKEYVSAAPRSPFDFGAAGVLGGALAWSSDVAALGGSSATTLGDLLETGVADRYHITDEEAARWESLRAGGLTPRTTRDGHQWNYRQGAMAFPDPLDRPARTITTWSGRRTPLRENHVVRDPQTGRLRRLTPVEVERCFGFPDGFTEGMPEDMRYHCLGNSVVVGVVNRVAAALSQKIGDLCAKAQT